MVLSASTVSLVSVAVTVLMVAAMLYLVWGALGNDVHSPSPGKTGHPDVDEGEETSSDDETQGELPDGSSA